MATLEDFDLSNKNTDLNIPIQVDAKGSQCPGPVMALKSGMDKASIGQQVIVEATDPGFENDALAWSAITGNPIISKSQNDGIITVVFEKKTEIGKASIPPKEDNVTLIIFSEELDRGIAAFNIALGALSLGMKVEIFFTFWGLSLLRKHNTEKEKKTMAQRLMDDLLPSNDKTLPLSHMNMMRLGAKFMSRVMKKEHITSLDFMIHLSKMDGIKFIACQMSMQMMGLTKEDLIDGVEVGGVATMIEYARKANLNYFI